MSPCLGRPSHGVRPRRRSPFTLSLPSAGLQASSRTAQVAAHFATRAVALGADAARVLLAHEVVVAEWPRLRCFYGPCASGRCLCCPPFTPEPARMRALLDAYEWVLLFRLDPGSLPRAGTVPGHTARLAMLAWQLEMELRGDGLGRAFALSGGLPCGLDEPCGEPASCHAREFVRPNPMGCGVDLDATGERVSWSVRGVVPDGVCASHALVLVG